MSTSITEAFIRQYEQDVHDVFQRQGSYLLSTVRHKPNVLGKSTTFQVVGKGSATTKARHGTITPMNATHTSVEVTLADFYAGDWVDKLDEAKINIDERMVIARTGARALGRKIDDLIVTELDSTTNTLSGNLSASSTAQMRADLLEFIEALTSNDVDVEDGMVYGLLTPRAYACAMTIEEFASADYVDDKPFTQGAPVRRWRMWGGVKWKAHTGLPGKGTASAKCFVYHHDGIGFGSQNLSGDMENPQSVSADITWHGDRAAHFVNHMMSGGSKLIDDTGVIEATFDDTSAVPVS